jgi:hypothetical protein
MYGELASVRSIVALSPSDALDDAQSFLTAQGYTITQRAGNTLPPEAAPLMRRADLSPRRIFVPAERVRTRRSNGE